MKQREAVAAQPPGSAGSAPQNVELRHLRYFVAVAEAGTFTEAAQRMFIAQPTLSQQLISLVQIRLKIRTSGRDTVIHLRRVIIHSVVSQRTWRRKFLDRQELYGRDSKLR